MTTGWSTVPVADVDTDVKQAALRAVAYADVFEYPLRAVEVHRHLHGVSATREATVEALERCSGENGPLSSRDGFFTLRGREALIEKRRTRGELATRLWPAAVRYGRLIGRLPFVKMVAVTGSLPWDTLRGDGRADPYDADIDYFIVAQPGRLWLSRLFVMVLGRVARLRGIQLCPNYLVSERALDLADRSIYTEYEVTQMVPVAGMGTYWRFRDMNTWSAGFLPNALDPRPVPPVERTFIQRGWERVVAVVAALAEIVLRSPLGSALERLEIRYRMNKIRRSRGTDPVIWSETAYGADRFKDHTSGRQGSILVAFGQRLSELGLPPR